MVGITFMVFITFMGDTAVISSQSQVPLYEKYITVIYALGSTHEENAI